MTVRFSVAGGRADIVIDRPEKANAITADMIRTIVARVAEASDDDDVKVIVLRAEGTMFTAGFDIADPADFAGTGDDPVRARTASISEKASWMADVFHAAKPIALQVHGTCIGIGTMLLLVADFAIVSDDAAFGFPEERFGSAGATWAYPFLIHEVGLKRATELVMTGRRFGAAEALDMGLVNRVVARGDLEGEVTDLAAALCSLPRDGIAVNRVAKRLATSMLGYDRCFTVHAPVHSNAERIQRSADEFDFMQVVADRGMREAVEERNRRFAGSWWGW